ncbi:LPXTG cell wall anchor domain-containing protein [Actinoplanes ianthinogenes]|nr:LPXTG cell wall anchor domain-containing protein [Actinoplanes ianthinogenes]
MSRLHAGGGYLTQEAHMLAYILIPLGLLIALAGYVVYKRRRNSGIAGHEAEIGYQAELHRGTGGD